LEICFKYFCSSVDHHQLFMHTADHLPPIKMFHFHRFANFLLILLCVQTTLPNLIACTETIADAANTGQDETNNTGKVCYETGCYESRRYEEASIFGSQMVSPDSIDTLDIKFYFFHKIGLKGKLLRFNSSTKALEGFNEGNPTYFAIHGWREKYKNLGWMEFLKDVILEKLNGKANVFLVDWGSESENLFYPKPAANTRVVGDAIAFFIQALRASFNVECDHTHLIGFSLGAQASGFAGSRLQKDHDCKLNSIEGLDPAGPFFRDSSADDRLDSTDASFVSVVHSNMASIVLKGFGNPQKSGHVDVFLNGGEIQPGCQPLDLAGEVVASGLSPASLGAVGCSHSRSEQFYRTDFEKLTKCQPVAYQCESYTEFGRGRCADCGEDGSKCYLVGFWPNYERRKPKDENEGFYLDSESSKPYCVYHHQIKIYVSPKASAMTGSIYMDFLGKTRDVKEIKYERILSNFVKGAPHTMLFKYSEPLGKVEQIRVYFKPSIKNRLIGIFKTEKMLVERIDFNYMSHIDPEVRKSFSSSLCPDGSLELPEDKNDKRVFKACTEDNDFSSDSRKKPDNDEEKKQNSTSY